MVSMVERSLSRSPVKSTSTCTPAPANIMMHIRSDVVICVETNFLAAVKARKLIVLRHGGQVEVQTDQAAVAITDVAGRFGRDLRAGQLGHGRRHVDDRHGRRRVLDDLFELLKFEKT
jgi:hypothetical protein